MHIKSGEPNPVVADRATGAASTVTAAKRDKVQLPVGPADRVFVLDVLRGVAIFGVLVAYCVWSLGQAPQESWSPLDSRLGELVSFAVDGKFYTLLAFLFGLGFWMQLDRATDDSVATEIYSRRLIVLALIGLGHALLLRNGDILLPYALTGFLLIPLRRQSDRCLLAIAIAALLTPYAARLLWEASGLAMPQRPDLGDVPYFVGNAAWLSYWYQMALFIWPLNLTLFLFGALAGRHRLLPRLAEKPRILWVILAAAFTAGTILYFTRLAWLEAAEASIFAGSFAGLLFTLHSWMIAAAYAAALLLAARSRFGAAALAPLAAVGRTALTNYLLQAAVIVPLCLLFGWFGEFTPTSSLMLAVSLFVLVHLPFSLLWLRRFPFGPAERVWRRLTYGRLQPHNLTEGYRAPL